MNEIIKKRFDKAREENDFITITQLAKEYPIPSDIREELYEHIIPTTPTQMVKFEREIKVKQTFKEFFTKYNLPIDRLEEAKKAPTFIVQSTDNCIYDEEIILLTIVLQKIMKKSPIQLLYSIYHNYCPLTIVNNQRGFHGLVLLTHMILLYHLPKLVIHLDKLKFTLDKLLHLFIHNLGIRICKNFEAIETVLDGIFTTNNNRLLFYYVFVVVMEDIADDLMEMKSENEIIGVFLSKQYDENEIKNVLSLAKCYLMNGAPTFNSLLSSCINYSEKFRQWYSQNSNDCFIMTCNPVDCVYFANTYKQQIQYVDLRSPELYQHGRIKSMKFVTARSDLGQNW